MSDSAGKVSFRAFPAACIRRAFVWILGMGNKLGMMHQRGQDRFGKRGKRRWTRRVVAFLVLASCLYLGKAPILRGMASLLVCDEPLRQCDCVFVIDCEGCYEKAAQWYHAQMMGHVLLTESKANSITELGVLPPEHELAIQQLAALDVPQLGITVLPGLTQTDWDRARRLQEWLTAHPDQEVTVLCERLGSMRLRRIFLATLDRPACQRVRWTALSSPRYDESNWWQVKDGALTFFDGWVGLVSIGLYGEEKQEPSAGAPVNDESPIR